MQVFVNDFFGSNIRFGKLGGAMESFGGRIPLRFALSNLPCPKVHLHIVGKHLAVVLIGEQQLWRGILLFKPVPGRDEVAQSNAQLVAFILFMTTFLSP